MQPNSSTYKNILVQEIKEIELNRFSKKLNAASSRTATSQNFQKPLDRAAESYINIFIDHFDWANFQERDF